MQNNHNGLPILFDGPANLYRGIEGVGGRLILTQEYLFFKPHAINIQKIEEIIYLRNIERVERKKTLWIIPNGLKVIAEQREYKFVVNKRNQWVAEINKLLKTS